MGQFLTESPLADQSIDGRLEEESFRVEGPELVSC